MEFLIKGIASFFLMAWYLVFAASVMSLGGPGASDDKKGVIASIGVLYYPVLIFIILGQLDIPYWGYNSSSLALFSAIAITALNTFVGTNTLIYNICRGVKNEGYCVVRDCVYYDGRHLKEADAQTFQVLQSNRYDREAIQAEDKNHSYRFGKAVHPEETGNVKITEQ